MKNKIILFLVLLIPSLCFGRSIKFQVSTDSNENFQKILVTDSKSQDRTSYIFKTHSLKVIVSDNATEIKKLQLKLMSIFPRQHNITEDSSFSIFRIFQFFEALGIYNDWQITNVKTTYSGDNSIHEMFMYKQDK